MLTSRALSRINNRPRKVNRLPSAALVGTSVIVAALLYVLEIVPTLGVLATLLAGVLVALGAYTLQRAKTITSLSYKGNLEEAVSLRFLEIQEALEDLSSSERIWHLGEKAEKYLPKAADDEEEPSPAPEREDARVGLLQTPGIRADVAIWGIEAGERRLLFFPEGILIYKGDLYTPVAYSSLMVESWSARFMEEEEEGVAEDGSVVERVWRYRRDDGSPDRRYKDNRYLPVLLYGLLKISSSKLKVHLMVSRVEAAVRFGRAFGAEERQRTAASGEKERNESHRRAEALQRDAGDEEALRTLGVDRGASMEEIGVAYRKLARTYHPDKVANLAEEVREYSEARMKEINSAYAHLKRRASDASTNRP